MSRRRDTSGSGTNIKVGIFILFIAIIAAVGIGFLFLNSGTVINENGEIKLPTPVPTPIPTSTPSVNPTVNPTTNPVSNPTVNPTTNPTVNPTSSPTVKPTSSTTNSSEKKLTAHFIDVGQGDCILLSYDGKYAMVDAGESLKEDSKPAVTAHLKDFQNLEWLLTTHQDYDHIGLAKYVMDTVPVKRFYDNGNTHTSKTYENMISTVYAKDIPYTVLKEGDTIDTWGDDISVKVVSSKITNGNDANDDSVVLLISYGNMDLCLVGDISQDVEKQIAEKIGQRAEILKVAHHGSPTSTSKEFVWAVHPETSIISVGENTYGHPSEDVIERLKLFGDVYRTDDYGCVVIDIGKDSYNVRHCEHGGEYVTQ